MKIENLDQIKKGIRVQKKDDVNIYKVCAFDSRVNGFEVVFKGKSPHNFDGILAFITVENFLSGDYYIVD